MHDDFARILQGLRSASLSVDDWKLLVTHCSEAAIKVRIGEDAFKANFLDGDATHYFFGNKERAAHNVKAMCSSGRPILRVDAVNTPEGAKSLSADAMQKVPNVAYFTHDSRQMWLRNVKGRTKHGICNGAKFQPKNFIFAASDGPPGLPIGIIAEMPGYTGPPFFCEEGREKWVVLRPVQVEFHSMHQSTRVREGFPTSLCYGLTAHKCQGTTNRGYGVVHFGDRESAENGSYTMVSRMTTMNNLYIPGGCSYSRLSTSLNTKKFRQRVEEEKRLDKVCEKTKNWWALRSGRL